MAAEELADLVRVDTKLKALNRELKTAVLARGSHLMDLHGIGPAGAARILADVGDVARFPDRDHFASWTGTAPLDASSGEHIRHRLSRAGNRRMNHVLYVAAISQIRQDSEGRRYYRRKLAAGQDQQGSPALPEAAAVRPRLPPAPRRRHQRRRRTRAAEVRRAREGTRGRLTNPARPTCTPRSSALRISHNPSPQHRRYPPGADRQHPTQLRLASHRAGAQEPSRCSAPPDERP